MRASEREGEEAEATSLSSSFGRTLRSHLEHMFRTFFIIKKLLAADSGNDGQDNDAAATPIALGSVGPNPLEMLQTD